MKKILLVTCFLISINYSFAQTDAAAKYAAVITGKGLNKHLSIIAGSEMEGRETGTEGQRKAAAYIEAQFKAIGLKPVPALKGYQQFYPLYQDSLKTADLVVAGKTAVYGTDFITQLNNNENGKFSGKKIIFAGYGIDDEKYSDYTGLDVKGKIVIIFLGEPKRDGKYFLGTGTRASEWTFPGTSKKLAVAAAKGASGVLIISPNLETFNDRAVAGSKKTGVYFPRDNSQPKSVNFAQLSHAFAKELIGNNFDTLVKVTRIGGSIDKDWAMEKKTKISFSFEKFRTIINASNVVGIIEGTDKKDEYVFLTGHYDHLGMRNGQIYYGADDDGSGTCAVIQMAEAFAKAAAEGRRPRRTIVFMTVSGEEKGLCGSGK